MPTYEYRCTSCGNAWDELQKISEPALEDCPKCHAKTAQRLISGGNFILKGGGWYADLYSSTGGANKGSSSSSTKSESTSESSSKSETSTKSESTSSSTASSSTSTGGSSSSS